MKSAFLRKRLEQHRSFIVSFILLCFLGCYVDLQPLGEQLYDIWAQQEILRFQLEEKEQAVAHMALASTPFARVHTSTTPGLRFLLQQAQLNRLAVGRVDAEKMPEEDKNSTAPHQGQKIKAVFQGSFADCYRFLEELYRQRSPFLLNQVALKQQPGALVLSLQVTAFLHVLEEDGTTSASHQSVALLQVRDPFQEGEGYPVAEEEQLTALRLEQLHYVGFLAQGEYRSGLLLSSNGVVIEAQLGTWLEKKKWKIIQIDPQAVILASADGKKRSQLLRE